MRQNLVHQIRCQASKPFVTHIEGPFLLDPSPPRLSAPRSPSPLPFIPLSTTHPPKHSNTHLSPSCSSMPHPSPVPHISQLYRPDKLPSTIDLLASEEVDVCSINIGIYSGISAQPPRRQGGRRQRAKPHKSGRAFSEEGS